MAGSLLVHSFAVGKRQKATHRGNVLAVSCFKSWWVADKICVFLFRISFLDLRAPSGPHQGTVHECRKRTVTGGSWFAPESNTCSGPRQ